ncbi:formylmethanofuran dehydrogenase subunit A [Aeoliella mucimassa]|uniref:Formyltransferase/hydrolase complex Fhc subunit A n=1 Tax=Aeoliella mucimassa TaxID=2527972 RepID=A0A518AIQ1_9BACT|nr:formylmethanofuran dehydrogenase subunit A [Aeoliella mucimassa]QDU54580.1 Formyltransferase/hydrolase complex Fhc subunit A [Aeoliella mucimassa]
MASLTKIAGGTLYDPANGIDGQVRDLWFADGKIVAPPTPGTKPTRTIDAEGLVVMPAGVDMHCHIAGPKVNVARKLRADDRSHPDQLLERTRLAAGGSTRSGSLGSVPSTFATAYKYAGLGYTTAFDAAVPPSGARQAHAELADTPSIDRGFYTLVGNNHYLMERIAAGDQAGTQAFLAWLLTATRSYAPKLVNPGGVETWKQQGAGHSTGLDDLVPTFNVTPRAIIQGIAQAANDLALPHPLHVHCNQLGMPGNWQTTLATMQSLGNLQGHLTHIQFHSYGGGQGEEQSLKSEVPLLAEYINSHDNLSVDVGQVLFGNTTSMTGDGPLGYYLRNIYGDRWYSADTEVEAGCGVMPIEYKNKNLVHALQWAIGLEWYLLVEDPWRVVMSTDHPNGGSFLAYPEIIRLLMDRTYRNDVLATCPAEVRERTSLGDLDREYTLGEIAIITRAGPARLLGLTQKGHLGVGADADITLYTPHDNWAEMFQLPRLVFKRGEVLVEQGEIRTANVGQTLHLTLDYDQDRLKALADWWRAHYSFELENFSISDQEFAQLG